LGLSFKPNTDDLRDAPALEIIHLLQNEGAQVRAYDPAASAPATELLPNVAIGKDPYEVAEGADALVVATEWNEFRHLDLQRIASTMRQPVLVDGRNIYDPETMRSYGFTYFGVGRGH
jgi:UDPglucose 6-dehydrogenase